MKTCRICKVSKEFSSFGKKTANSDGLATLCKECRSINDKITYAANPEKARARQKFYYNMRLYGLNEEEIEKLKELQNWKCAICNEERRLVVDHNHQNGRVRGMLCDACNTKIIPLLETNSVALNRAIDYIARDGAGLQQSLL